MSDKYIIKNCEVIFRNGDFYFCQSSKNLGKNVYCQDCTDCPLKQIITECRDAKIRANDYARNPYSGGIYDEANRILDFLDIQECNDE